MSRRGRHPVHEGYSLIVRDELIKDHPRIRQYLQDCRDGLIADLAGREEQLTTAQRVLVDRVIGKLGILRFVEVHVRNKGIFEDGRLIPVLQENFLAWANSLRLDLQALGIEKRVGDRVLSPLEYVRQCEEKQKV